MPTAMPIPIPGPLKPLVDAGVSVVNGIESGADAGNAVIDSIVATKRWISDRHNWLRIAWFAVGYSLVVGGALMLARKPIAQTADFLGAKIDTAKGLAKSAAVAVK